MKHYSIELIKLYRLFCKKKATMRIEKSFREAKQSMLFNNLSSLRVLCTNVCCKKSSFKMEEGYSIYKIIAPNIKDIWR